MILDSNRFYISTWAPLTFGAGHFVAGGGPTHCRMFSSVSVLQLLEAIAQKSPLPSCNKQKHLQECQMPFKRQKHTPTHKPTEEPLLQLHWELLLPSLRSYMTNQQSLPGSSSKVVMNVHIVKPLSFYKSCIQQLNPTGRNAS